jgi:hypothetical protein
MDGQLASGGQNHQQEEMNQHNHLAGKKETSTSTCSISDRRTS